MKRQPSRHTRNTDHNKKPSLRTALHLMSSKNHHCFRSTSKVPSPPRTKLTTKPQRFHRTKKGADIPKPSSVQRTRSLPAHLSETTVADTKPLFWFLHHAPRRPPTGKPGQQQQQQAVEQVLTITDTASVLTSSTLADRDDDDDSTEYSFDDEIVQGAGRDRLDSSTSVSHELLGLEFLLEEGNEADA